MLRLRISTICGVAVLAIAGTLRGDDLSAWPPVPAPAAYKAVGFQTAIQRLPPTTAVSHAKVAPLSDNPYDTGEDDAFNDEPDDKMSDDKMPEASTADKASVEGATPPWPSDVDAKAPAANIAGKLQSGSCGGCSGCGDCCCGYCRPRWSPYIGTEATFLGATRNRGGGALYALDNGVNVTTQQSPNASGMIVSPRVWLGLQRGNWGIVTRYWNWYNLGGGAAPLGAPTPNFSQATVRLQTFDLEAQRRFQAGCHNMWWSIGARYAQFDRNSSVSTFNDVGGSILTGTALAGTRFYGTGLTTGLYGKRPIGCGNLNFFYGGRVSVLWDNNAIAAAQTQASFMGAGGSSSSSNFATSSANSNLFIGEVVAGLQYDYALKCVPSNAFFRVNLEYQYWNLNNTGSASANSFAGSIGPGSAIGAAVANSGGGNLELLGFGLATGFMW